MVPASDGEEDSPGEASGAETVEVAMPRELLREVDAFAAYHGFESPDAVVAAALERHGEESEE